MTPLLQLHRRLRYLFIPLLLAGFAMPAIGGDPTPNRREIMLNYTHVPHVSCAGEDVDLRGVLEIKFKHRPDGVAPRGLEDISLPKGFNGITCKENEPTCLVGKGQRTGRKYMASTIQIVPGSIKPLFPEKNGLPGSGQLKLKLRITGVPNPPGQPDSCPGCTVPFSLVYTVTWRFKNKDVNFFQYSKPPFAICCRTSGCF
jgi:hypothetical protein